MEKRSPVPEVISLYVADIEEQVSIYSQLVPAPLDDGEEDEDIAKYIFLPRELLARAEHVLGKLKNPGTVGASGGSVMDDSVKLPRMELPKFSGKLDEFCAFRELFQSAVERKKSLTGAERLLYLKSCLQGEAAKVVGGLKLVAANYDLAWRHLEKRFGKSTELVETHLNNLLSLNDVKIVTRKNLRVFIDSIESEVHCLDNLDFSESKYNELVFPVIMNKLPFDLRLTYSRAYVTNPGIKTLLEFLELEMNSHAIAERESYALEAALGLRSRTSEDRSQTKKYHLTWLALVTGEPGINVNIAIKVKMLLVIATVLRG